MHTTKNKGTEFAASRKNNHKNTAGCLLSAPADGIQEKNQEEFP